MKPIAWMVGALLLLAVVLNVTLVLVLVVAASGLYRGGRALQRRRTRNAQRYAHDRAELLARAEIQHRWYLVGDPRGTYGRYTPAA